MSFTPVARVPLSLEVAQRLRAAILDGTVESDEELPTEAELAKTFGVGRSTIREALRVLQSQGLVSGADSISTTRPRVTIHTTTDTAGTALHTAIQVGALPLQDLVELRVLLEADVMRSVTKVPEGARDLLDHMRNAAAVGDIEAFHIADVEFHTMLAKAGGNRAIGLVIDVLRSAIAGYLRDALAMLSEPTTVLNRLCDEHEAIATALSTGDHDLAAAAVVAHIENFYSEPHE